MNRESSTEYCKIIEFDKHLHREQVRVVHKSDDRYQTRQHVLTALGFSDSQADKMMQQLFFMHELHEQTK